jgi:hypothetical protein
LSLADNDGGLFSSRGKGAELGERLGKSSPAL